MALMHSALAQRSVSSVVCTPMRPSHHARRMAPARGWRKNLTGPEDAARLADLDNRFRMADVDGNGFIDREELRALLESTGSGSECVFLNRWLPDEELDAALAQYDTNGDGVISLDEFRQLAYDGILLEGTLLDYEEAFKAVDSSGNGTIGANELASLFQRLGQPITMEALVDVMQKYDKDESGQIEFSEFLLMFRDKVFDLQAMSEYMTMPEGGSSSTEPGRSSAVLVEPLEAHLTLIFSEAELDELLARTAAEGRCLLLFTALTWCRPCKAMQRPVQKMAEHYKEGLVVAKLFGNSNSRTKSLFKKRLQIRSTPCFIVFKDGEPVYTQTGSNKDKLEAGLRSVLPADKLPEKTVYPMPVAAAAPSS